MKESPLKSNSRSQTVHRARMSVAVKRGRSSRRRMVTWTWGRASPLVPLLMDPPLPPKGVSWNFPGEASPALHIDRHQIQAVEPWCLGPGATGLGCRCLWPECAGARVLQQVDGAIHEANTWPSLRSGKLSVSPRWPHASMDTSLILRTTEKLSNTCGSPEIEGIYRTFNQRRWSQ